MTSFSSTSIVPLPAAAGTEIRPRPLLIPDFGPRTGRIRILWDSQPTNDFFVGGTLDQNGSFSLCTDPAEALLVEFIPAIWPHKLKITVLCSYAISAQTPFLTKFPSTETRDGLQGMARDSVIMHLDNDTSD